MRAPGALSAGSNRSNDAHPSAARANPCRGGCSVSTRGSYTAPDSPTRSATTTVPLSSLASCGKSRRHASDAVSRGPCRCTSFGGEYAGAAPAPCASLPCARPSPSVPPATPSDDASAAGASGSGTDSALPCATVSVLAATARATVSVLGATARVIRACVVCRADATDVFGDVEAGATSVCGAASLSGGEGGASVTSYSMLRATEVGGVTARRVSATVAKRAACSAVAPTMNAAVGAQPSLLLALRTREGT